MSYGVMAYTDHNQIDLSNQGFTEKAKNNKIRIAKNELVDAAQNVFRYLHVFFNIRRFKKSDIYITITALIKK